MAKQVKEGKITESRLEEASTIRTELFIQLVAQVLHEQLIIEKHTLHERMSNLVDLNPDLDDELRDTVYALINKL